MTAPRRFPTERRDGTLSGVYVAIVRDNEDPASLGRVRLEYPWRETAGKSDWARIAVPMAGDDRGTYFLPEPDDEVLVAFEGGDVDHPYVVGGLWNGRDRPPVEDHDGRTKVSRVRSGKGQELTFDDGEDGGRIVLRTAAGHRVVLDDQSETVTVEDTGGNKLELDGATGDISISSGGAIKIEASRLELESDGDLRIDAGGNLSLTGTTIHLN